MKIAIYSFRDEEAAIFRETAGRFGLETVLCREAPTLENAALADGCPCISIITTPVDARLLERFYQAGVRYISTRTIGFDHIDLESARRFGIAVGNTAYSPNSVAEYAVMLILMLLRRMPLIMARNRVQDYALNEFCGRELRNMTVGVIGTGRIGKTAVRILSGFGCRLLACDIAPDPQIANLAEYVPFERLLSECDLLTLHTPANNGNFHLIRRDTLAMMKNGVYIVNTARGSLIHAGDLIDAIESGKVGAAALDVVEDETGLYYNDLKGQVVNNRELALLKSYPNVIVTSHTAFYTDQAVRDMVENSVVNCAAFLRDNNPPSSPAI